MQAVTARADRTVERVLRAYGLPVGTIQPFGTGNVNESWRVEAEGKTYVLRRYSTLRMPSGISFEHELLAGLASGSWPVAAPYPAPDGSTLVKVENRFHALFPFLPGSRLDDPARHGAVLARLHGAMSCVRLTARPTWPRLADYGRRPFADLLAAYAAVDPDEAAEVLRIHGQVSAVLANRPRLPSSPVHGDFHTGNLLFVDGQLSGVLDFDFARVDWRAADIAIALGFLPVDAWNDFLEAYEAHSPLEDAERTIVPSLQRARDLERLAYALRRWDRRHADHLAGVKEAVSRVTRR
jgi:homoserine kinase type II